jgi:ribosomal protein L19
MDQKIIDFNKSQQHTKFPEVKIGDVVRIHRTIKEGEKSRVQFFEGLVLAIKGRQSSSPTVTVRKVTKGIGVEMVFPIFSPVITKIEIVRHSKVRRSKLYYMRDRFGKAAKMKTVDPTKEEVNFYDKPKENENAKKDDLTKIEGIGPKIAEALNENAITTFAKLAEAKDEDTQKMIKDIKGNHQADTWNEQAALARDSKWDELKKLQDKLDGGVDKEKETK